VEGPDRHHPSRGRIYMYDDAASRKSDNTDACGRGWVSFSPRSLCGKSVPREKAQKKSFLWTPPGTRMNGFRDAPDFLAHTNTSGKQRQPWRTSAASFIMDGRHPQRRPRRAALPISSADSGERSVAARWSWVAPGMSAAALLSLTQQFTLCKVRYWRYPINQQEECFGGSIVLHMHRISLDIVGFEQKGREAVEL
jgi:hypothetical protein